MRGPTQTKPARYHGRLEGRGEGRKATNLDQKCALSTVRGNVGEKGSRRAAAILRIGPSYQKLMKTTRVVAGGSVSRKLSNS